MLYFRMTHGYGDFTSNSFEEQSIHLRSKDTKDEFVEVLSAYFEPFSVPY